MTAVALLLAAATAIAAAPCTVRDAYRKVQASLPAGASPDWGLAAGAVGRMFPAPP